MTADERDAATWGDVSETSFAATVDQAIGTALNEVGAKAAGHRPLSWHYEPETNEIEGVAASEDYTVTEKEPVLAGWATLLGLSHGQAPMRGTVEFRGDIGAPTVVLWGVVDQTAWETAT